MGYWTDRKKEEEAEIAGVMLSIFPIKRENMDIVDDYEEVKRSESDVYINSPVTREEIPDDVEYNEQWWKGYCQENKLEVTTGKSLRGR